MREREREDKGHARESKIERELHDNREKNSHSERGKVKKRSPRYR